MSASATQGGHKQQITFIYNYHIITITTPVIITTIATAFSFGQNGLLFCMQSLPKNF